jgi:hypothetical protein
VHGTLLAPKGVGIGPASLGEWLTRHKVGRKLRIAVLAMVCAFAWFYVFAPERVEARFRPPPRETPDFPVPRSLPMKHSIFPQRLTRA